MSITKKINDLFELRLLPNLTAGSKIAKGSDYYKGLIQLQKSIYDLDRYLEKTWDLKPTKLDQHWNKIYDQLSSLGVAKKRQEDYVKHIKKYQKHEIQLRDGKLPFNYTMDYFYFYKSCDVKLMRRLIYDQLPNLEKQYPILDWRFFDFITELHDDIEDVFEDVDDYNGNSFLLSINSKGLDHSIDIFQDYINDIEWRLDEKYRGVKKVSKVRMYELTKDAIMHLNILLMQRKEELLAKPIGEALVLRKLSLEINL